MSKQEKNTVKYTMYQTYTNTSTSFKNFMYWW